MSTLPKIKDLKKEPSVTTAGKLFAARVVNNNDPQKLQRIQIRIKHIHRGVADDDLPWALPVRHSSQGNNSVGIVSVPVVGSRVLIEYLDDYSLLYRGDFNQDATLLSELTATNYPDCYGFIDKSGNKFLVDTKDDIVTFTHLSGTTISILRDGTTSIKAPKSITLSATENLNVKVGGAVNVSCTAFNVNSTSITLRASGAAILAAASSILSATSSIVVNAASFALNAAFNLSPISGWVTPPEATSTAPASSPSTPDTVTARTKPTISTFVDKTDY